MAEHFRDLRAAITGAGSGIGRAIALRLARDGCHLALSDVNGDAVEEVASEARALGVRASASVVDVSDADAMLAWAAQVLDEGPVHVLVNNAGVAIAGRIVDTTPADWRWIVEINLLGVGHGIHAFVPAMLQQEGPRHVLNVSSASGLTGVPGVGVYAACKAAVLSLSEALASEHDHEGLRVHVLCPGFVATSLGDTARVVGLPEGASEGLRRITKPPGRHVDQVAEAAIRAMKRNRFLVPVYREAHALRFLRTLPPLLAHPVRRRLARDLLSKVDR